MPVIKVENLTVFFIFLLSFNVFLILLLHHRKYLSIKTKKFTDKQITPVESKVV